MPITDILVAVVIKDMATVRMIMGGTIAHTIIGGTIRLTSGIRTGRIIMVIGPIIVLTTELTGTIISTGALLTVVTSAAVGTSTITDPTTTHGPVFISV